MFFGRGSAPNPAEGAYSATLDPLAGEEEKLSLLSAFGLKFRSFGPQESEPKRHTFHEQSELL